MEKILFFLLLISVAAIGQSGDNNLLMKVTGPNSQPFEVKNDSIVIRKSVLQFLPQESIVDQSNLGNFNFSIGLFSSIGQTFKAGRNGELTALRLQTTHAYSDVTLRVFKGTSASGTLLSTTVFNQLGGTRLYNLTNTAQMIAGEMYFFDISPAYSYHFNDGYYLNGEQNSTVVGNTRDLIFETILKQYPLVII